MKAQKLPGSFAGAGMPQSVLPSQSQLPSTNVSWPAGPGAAQLQNGRPLHVVRPAMPPNGRCTDPNCQGCDAMDPMRLEMARREAFMAQQRGGYVSPSELEAHKYAASYGLPMPTSGAMGMLPYGNGMPHNPSDATLQYRPTMGMMPRPEARGMVQPQPQAMPQPPQSQRTAEMAQSRAGSLPPHQMPPQSSVDIPYYQPVYSSYPQVSQANGFARPLPPHMQSQATVHHPSNGLPPTSHPGKPPGPGYMPQYDMYSKMRLQQPQQQPQWQQPPGNFPPYVLGSSMRIPTSNASPMTSGPVPTMFSNSAAQQTVGNSAVAGVKRCHSGDATTGPQVKRSCSADLTRPSSNPSGDFVDSMGLEHGMALSTEQLIVEGATLDPKNVVNILKFSLHEGLIRRLERHEAYLLFESLAGGRPGEPDRIYWHPGVLCNMNNRLLRPLDERPFIVPVNALSAAENTIRFCVQSCPCSSSRGTLTLLGGCGEVSCPYKLAPMCRYRVRICVAQKTGYPPHPSQRQQVMYQHSQQLPMQQHPQHHPIQHPHPIPQQMSHPIPQQMSHPIPQQMSHPMQQQMSHPMQQQMSPQMQPQMSQQQMSQQQMSQQMSHAVPQQIPQQTAQPETHVPTSQAQYSAPRSVGSLAPRTPNSMPSTPLGHNSGSKSMSKSPYAALAASPSPLSFNGSLVTSQASLTPTVPETKGSPPNSSTASPMLRPPCASTTSPQEMALFDSDDANVGLDSEAVQDMFDCSVLPELSPADVETALPSNSSLSNASSTPNSASTTSDKMPQTPQNP